jgi:phasin family protein
MFAPLKDLPADNTLHVEAGKALADTAFESAERFLALNLNVSRHLFEQSIAHIKALQEARDVRSFVNLRAARTQPAIDAAINYSRSICEIASETREETARIVGVQLADVSADLSDVIDRVLQRAPAGSEGAVAVIRTAIDTANSAYDRMNGVALKVAEMTQANVSAARQASFQAAANAATMGDSARQKAA